MVRIDSGSDLQGLFFIVRVGFSKTNNRVMWIFVPGRRKVHEGNVGGFIFRIEAKDSVKNYVKVR